jgi:hypothetical protein
MPSNMTRSIDTEESHGHHRSETTNPEGTAMDFSATHFGKNKLEKDLQHESSAISPLGHGVVKVYVGPLGSTSPLPPPYGDRTSYLLPRPQRWPPVHKRRRSNRPKPFRSVSEVSTCLPNLPFCYRLAASYREGILRQAASVKMTPHRHQIPDAQGVMRVPVWRSLRTHCDGGVSFGDPPHIYQDPALPRNEMVFS